MKRSERYLRRLPDAYAKTPTSNNAKLLGVCAEALQQAADDLKWVDDSTDLNLATGTTLDLYGAMVGQPRGALDDTQYRYLIRGRIAHGFVSGDYRGVVAALAHIFDAEREDIQLQDAAPATVRVAKLPFAVLQHAGFTTAAALAIIQRLLPAGVAVQAENFEGTFCFAAAEDDYDAAAGFSDNGDPLQQTMGGYFGLVVGDDESTPLPL